MGRRGGRAVVVGHGQYYRVGGGQLVGVGDRLAAARSAVAEGPGVVDDGPIAIGGAAAAEVERLAHLAAGRAADVGRRRLVGGRADLDRRRVAALAAVFIGHSQLRRVGAGLGVAVLDRGAGTLRFLCLIPYKKNE